MNPRDPRPIDLEFALLERLDLALAARAADGTATPDVPERLGAGVRELLEMRGPRRWSWIAGVLQLRGLKISAADVRGVFARSTGAPCRIEAGSHEDKLIQGLGEVLDRVVEAAEHRRTPTGGSMVGLFEVLTRRLARFRNNTIRKDVPWDGVLYVHYPEPGRCEALLGEFDEEHDFRDIPALFRPLHPVRRSFRVFWRFARIAPFPDFNTVMAFVAMTQYLLAHGYPAIVPDFADRAILHKLLATTPPKRFVRFENRLLAMVQESDGSGLPEPGGG